MKKLKYLLLLPFLALTSCGDNALTGVYGFSLGNEGAHFAAYAELSNEDYVDPNFNFGGDKKKFKLTLELPGDSVDPQVSDLLDSADGEINLNSGKLEGYYYFGENTVNGIRVNIGVGVIDQIFEEIIIIPDISKEIMQYIISAYILEKNFVAHIPVSAEDLQLQLLWYGFYIDIDNLKLVDLFDTTKSVVDFWPGPEKCGPTGKQNREARIGVLPTATQISTINEIMGNHRDVFDNPNIVMRSLHILKLSLAKL